MTRDLDGRLMRLERALTAPEAEPAPTITPDMDARQAANIYAAELRRGLPPRRLVDMTDAERAKAEAAYAATIEENPRWP